VFFWYGIALAIVFFAFVMILTRNGQSAPTIPTTTTNAMTTPAFM
jgi:tellurite resistance protein TehA-like permease